jgi:hypothetical protein
MIPPRRAARGVAAGAVLACAAALLAACSTPQKSTAAPTKTVTVSASPSASPSTATPSAAPSTSAPSGPGPCPTRYLKLKLGLAQGAAGSVYQVIEFKNIGPSACTLYGYPGVSLAGGSPITQIGRAASENPTPPRKLVTLAPHAVANALLQVVEAGNYPPSKCHPKQASYLQIYPPNQTTPIYLAYSATACASSSVRILSVDVVRPGSGG